MNERLIIAMQELWRQVEERPDLSTDQRAALEAAGNIVEAVVCRDNRPVADIVLGATTIAEQTLARYGFTCQGKGN